MPTSVRRLSAACVFRPRAQLTTPSAMRPSACLPAGPPQQAKRLHRHCCTTFDRSSPLLLLPCRWADLTVASITGFAVPLQLCCNTVYCHTAVALQPAACGSQVPPSTHLAVCWLAAPLNLCFALRNWAPTHCSCPVDGRRRLRLPPVAHLADRLGQLQRSVHHHDGHQPNRALPRPETAA